MTRKFPLFRIGNGYDIHKLVKNRDLIIGGVKLQHPDKLGLDGKLPANHSDEKALERGLNLLYADGWELVAVEGGRMRTFNGGRDASLEIPPSYIFRRYQTGE